MINCVLKELRTRNWKLIEALKIAEKHSSTTSVNVVSVIQSCFTF